MAKVSFQMNIINLIDFRTKDQSNQGLIQPKTNSTKDWSNQGPIQARIQPKIDPAKEQSKQGPI